MSRTNRIILLLLFPIAFLCSSMSIAASIEPIKVGFRCDAPPFSYVNGERSACDSKEPRHESRFRGYIADICKAIFREMRREIVAMEVTATNRFARLKDGYIDILCDPTTVTTERTREMYFSQFVFLSGVSYLFVPGGAGGKADRKVRIGHLKGTTAKSRIDAMIGSEIFGVKKDETDLVPYDDHFAGVAAICGKELDFYIADRDILTWLLREESTRQKCNVAASRNFFSYEPYAISISRKHPELALEIQRAFYAIVERGDVDRALSAHFGLKNLSSLFQKLLSLYRIPTE